MKRFSKSEIVFKVISYTIVLIFALITLYPVIYTFSASISGKSPFEAGKVVLFPKDVTFEVYKLLYRENQFWVSYVNTLFYTVFGTIWSMLISITGAYALSKKKLLFRKQFNFIVVFTMWFSAGMIPLYLNYTSMGVANKYGIIIAFGIQAYNIILLRNYFESVPKEIEEAAEIDGASEFTILRKIYLPMSKAALATVTLFYATARWNGYFWSMVLLKNPTEMPVQVYIKERIKQFTNLIEQGGSLTYSPDSYIYAIIVCSIIPVLIIYPFIQKYFAKGVSLGGVKE